MTEPTPDEYDPAADSYGCYELGIASWREICIRKKQVAPRAGDAQEARWAASGMCPIPQLDTVKQEARHG